MLFAVGGSVALAQAGDSLTQDRSTKGIIAQIRQSSVLYVDDDATGANDGSSWSDSYTLLQDALAAAAASGGVITEVHVAQGIYTPDLGAGQTPGDREATFQLVNGVALMGGYYGCPGGNCASGNPDERNITMYETALNGDLGGNDESRGDKSENSYHVVTGSGSDSTAILDGFTITGGNANASEPNDRGGGMFNEFGDPTLIDCVFAYNVASGYDTNFDARGGGVYNSAGDPALTNCTFLRNTAWGGWGTSGLGGGMYNRDGSRPTLSRCTFLNNTADGGFEGGLGAGGGMFNYNDSQPTLTNCIFSGNQAGSYGGGLCDSDSSSVLINCVFNGNATTAWADRDYGGAIYNSGGALVLTNCTVFDNRSEYCGGLYNTCDPTTIVTNCIFWHNTDRAGMSESSQISGAPLDINYTCVEGLTGALGGTGNIRDDPMFLDFDNGDHHVDACSPVVDAGDPTFTPPPDETDIDGDDRVIGDRVDMGADEVAELCFWPIPAVSEWGLVGMTLLVLAAGTAILVRRRVTAT